MRLYGLPIPALCSPCCMYSYMPLKSGLPDTMNRESLPLILSFSPLSLLTPLSHWVVVIIPEDPTWNSSSARLQEPVGQDAGKLGSEVLIFLPKRACVQLGYIQRSGSQPVSANKQRNWGKIEWQQGAPKPGSAAKPSVSKNYIIISQVLAKLQDNVATKVKIFQTHTKKGNTYWKQ